MGLIDFSLNDIGDVLVKAREAITGKRIIDDNEAKKLEIKLKEIETALLSGQIEINKIEAKNSNVFVAGWRPFIGWVCGVAIAYHFVLYPFLVGVFGLFEINYVLPTLEMGVLFNLLLAMLGMAGLRTYEKLSDVHNKH